MATLPQFHYGEHHLTPTIAIAIARNQTKGILSSSVKGRIRQSEHAVEEIANSDAAVYGINTGFGPLCTTRISKEETGLLQKNLLMSHAVGLGNPIPKDIAKLMMILKVHALAKGFSGVKLRTIERIIWHIENDAIPVVPEQGSVGASGDLAPLSHLFLPLIGLGELWYQEEKMETSSFLQMTSLAPVELGAKEGLGLINGTQFIAAFGTKVIEKMHNLLLHANISAAMMVEGLLASVKPFAAELHELRPFSGTQQVASLIRDLLEGSEIVHSHASCARVQDPYSLRCVPQVHGASYNALMHLEELLTIELNSVTDNPVVFNVSHTISGGNFHGQPLALPLDYACIAAAELGNISDRRTYLSLEGDTPGVPKLLLKETGTNSGFMIPQYTSAALVSENKGLCFPASADSVPTSLGQEDHVSMGSISGRKALQVIENVEKIIGIELFCAAQAINFHRPLRSSELMERLHTLFRSKVPFIEKDTLMYPLMQEAIQLVKDGTMASVLKETAHVQPTFDSN